MDKRAWSSRIVIRYILLQIPALVVLILVLIVAKRWINLPVWFIWGLIALWAAKDAGLFFFTWRAYDPDYKDAGNLMIGQKGIAETRLAPTGYVQVGGELWQAEIEGDSLPVEKGESVKIYANRGLTLLVHPDREENSAED